MPYLKSLSFALLAFLAVTGEAQVLISHRSRMKGLNGPTEDGQVITGPSAWEAQGKLSEVSVHEEVEAEEIYSITATSKFSQSDYVGAELRSKSSLWSLSSQVSQRSYTANTSLFSTHNLKLETGGSSGQQLNVKLIVPMHGILTARGNLVADAEASAEMITRVSRLDGTEIDQMRGKIKVNSTGFETIQTTAEGDWQFSAIDKEVDFEMYYETYTHPGAELFGYTILDLGTMAGDSTFDFSIFTDMRTEAIVQNMTMFAMADFSGTGGFQIELTRPNGDAFTDFSVTPGAVPEPASLIAISLGLAATLRRRRPSN